ncbi:MAG: MFS transporter [Eubacteriaceae bacterium]|nr:MFS transporter [Eubacteriaceae bacterium]
MSNSKSKGLGIEKYGWLLVLTGVALFYINVAFNADGSNVFAPAVAAGIGVSSGVILSMNSIAGIIGVVISILAGQLNRKIGPRKICGWTFLIGGAAYIVAANAVSVPMYTIAMCFSFGGLNSAIFVGFGAINANWFPKKLGAIMGIATMGAGLGTMTYVIIFSKLIESMGVRTASIIPGGICIIIAIIGLIVNRDTPAERGLNPDNVSDEVFRKEYAASGREEDITGGWTIAKLFKTKEMWFCAVSCGLLMLCQVGIMSQLVVRNLEVGFSQSTAVLLMSFIAVFGLVFAPITGSLVAKFGPKKVMAVVCIIMAIAVFLNATGIRPLYWASIILIGITSTAPPNFVNSLPGSVFGRVGFPVVNSVLFPIIAIIQMLNFAVNGLITMMFGSLQISYISFGVMILVSLILVAAVKDHKFNRDFLAGEAAEKN